MRDNIHALSEIRTRTPSNEAPADLHLKLHGHDVGKFLWYMFQFIFCLYASFSNTKCNCDACLFSEHISYIRDLIGVDHIGVGGDFDGINR
jgi:hypothetical protein